MTTRIQGAAKLIGLILLGLLMLGMAGWGVLALLYWDHANPALRHGLAVAFAAASLMALVGSVLRRWRGRAIGGFFALFALLLACWFRSSPRTTAPGSPTTRSFPLRPSRATA